MQTPKVDKIVINMGVVMQYQMLKLDKAVEELALITGQNHLSQKLKIYRWIPFT